MDYDIIVGVGSKDCEATIQPIVQSIDKALQKYSGKTGLILCVDGFSTDETKKRFGEVETKADKKFLTEKGKKGKGSAVKTILQKAKEHRSEAVVLIDGDFISFSEDVIHKLLSPVLKGQADVVIPHYVKDKNDLILSNHLFYPLTKALYQSPIKQPLAGDFGLSRKASLKLLQSKFFPYDHGVDIFITLTGLCESLKTAEVKMGVKDHSSSAKYAKPEEHLMPLFNQVMKSFIQLTRYYRTAVSKEGVLEVKKMGKLDGKRPKRIDIDVASYKELSRNTITNHDEYAQAIYEQINKQSVMGMKVAWLNHVSNYLETTKNMSNEKADKELEKTVLAFKKNKELFRL